MTMKLEVCSHCATVWRQSAIGKGAQVPSAIPACRNVDVTLTSYTMHTLSPIGKSIPDRHVMPNRLPPSPLSHTLLMIGRQNGPHYRTIDTQRI